MSQYKQQIIVLQKYKCLINIIFKQIITKWEKFTDDKEEEEEAAADTQKQKKTFE